MRYALNYWAELLKYEYLLPVIPKLGSYEVGLHLAVRPDKVEGLASVMHACDRHDVPVTLWPLLPVRQGYWVNAWNLGVQEKWIAYLAEHFPPRRFALDLEAPKNFKGISGRVRLAKLLRTPGNRPREVRARMERLVDQLHDQGFGVFSTSMFTNPSSNWKKGLPRPRNADAYSYMIYTSFFQRFTTPDDLDNVVYWCARRIHAGHGPAKGAIDLGCTSVGVIQLSHFLGVSGLERVQREIGVALYAGLRNIQVFALDEITRDVDRWLAGTRDVAPRKPPLFTSDKRGLIYKLFKKILFHEDLALENDPA